MHKKKEINIFISSPGDVRQERYIANQVISEISNTFNEYVEINCLMWEKMALPATETFQEGIDFITSQYHIDIAVFILWTRLGSNPGSKFLKDDGTEYSSGTEYEYDMMKALHARNNGDTKILFYLKQAPFKDAISALNNEDEIQEAIKQHGELKQFLCREFKEDNSTASKAYGSFYNAQEFREQLTTHLKDLLKRIIGKQYKSIKEWKGNPYVGLDAFSYEYRDVFYGRTNFTTRIAADLIRESESGRSPSMILVGESGSGKSSLIDAGLFPFLKEGFTDRQSFNIIKFTPSSFNGKPYNGLIKIILDNFPEISGNPAFNDIQTGIPEQYDFKYLSYALQHTVKKSVPIIFFDQFEELFCDTQITEDERIRFISLLAGLVQSDSMWIIISMRNDFYNKFSTYPKLDEIKKTSLFYDVPNMTISEISQIVSEPARKVGLQWEIDSNGNNLEKIVINDAAELKDLPLIEFALYQLYERKDENDFVSIESYEKMGRLKGAFIKHADGFYNLLSDNEKSIFREILSSVITTTPDNNNVFARKTSLRSCIETDETHRKLIDKLIQAHIFKSGKDSENQATITIVHEMLLYFWPVIADWCSSQINFIEMNDFYETQSQYWKDGGKPKNKLLDDAEDILDAEYFMFSWEQCASMEAKEYVKTSVAYYRKKKLAFWLFVDSILALLGIFEVYSTFWGKDNLFNQNPLMSLFEFFIDIPLWLAIYHIVKGRFKGEFLYESSFKIMTLFGITSALYVIDFGLQLLINEPLDNTLLYFIIIAIFICAYIGSYLNYQIHNKIWKKNSFDTVKLRNRTICRTKKLLKKIISVASVVCALLAIILSLWLKQSRLDDALIYSDNAFYIINTLYENGQLTGNQSKLMFDYEKDYFLTLYEDELNQTDSCSQHKIQCAKCLYYLDETDIAIALLENPLPTTDIGKLYYAIFNAELGRTDKVKSFLTSDPVSHIDSIEGLSLKRIHWAECFNLLERAREELNLVQSGSDGDIKSIMIGIAEANLAFLETGDISQLIDNYKSLLTQCPQDENDISPWRTYIYSHFMDLCWYNDIPLSEQNEVLVFLDEKQMPFCSTVSDSLTTHNYRMKLAGDWNRIEVEDSTISVITMSIFSEYDAMRRISDVYKDDEFMYSESSIHQYRLFVNEGQLYLDRYAPEQTGRNIIALEIEDDKLTYQLVYPDSTDVEVYEKHKEDQSVNI